MIEELPNDRRSGEFVGFTYHEEVRPPERILPLFLKSERGERKTRDEHDGRFGRVTD